ncbi:MAG: serine/threonine protein kinase, partial [Myxococcales bacterium]
MECPRCGHDYEPGIRYCGECGYNLADAAPTDADDTYMGRVLGGKYLVLKHLGDGGMGRVYAAEHLTLNKKVAVKILHKSLLRNETQVKRFQREAWSASRLDHPNSISIIDFGATDDGSHFIIMEYLEGRDLTTVIAEDFPLKPERIVHIMAQVLSVLYDAHQKKIIHRDLKPDNIMLISRAGEPDFAKVLDFGIAKLQERDPSQPALTMQGIICGTPEYMSPEQAMGRELDARTDIYSAGCILYQMLTGQVPFDANNYQAILGMHIREEPARPSSLRPDLGIHPKLEEIALIAMQKQRDMRFTTALAMKHALELVFRTPSELASEPSQQAINAGGRTIFMGSGGESSSTVEPSARPEAEPLLSAEIILEEAAPAEPAQVEPPPPEPQQTPETAIKTDEPTAA